MSAILLLCEDTMPFFGDMDFRIAHFIQAYINQQDITTKMP